MIQSITTLYLIFLYFSLPSICSMRTLFVSTFCFYYFLFSPFQESFSSQVSTPLALYRSCLSSNLRNHLQRSCVYLFFSFLFSLILLIVVRIFKILLCAYRFKFFMHSITFQFQYENCARIFARPKN